MKRIRVKKPGQEVFKSELSEYIKAEELYIGATVNVNGYLFLLLNADEYTLNYMETNSDMVSCVILDLRLSACRLGFSFSRPFCLHPATSFTLCTHTCGHE